MKHNCLKERKRTVEPGRLFEQAIYLFYSKGTFSKRMQHVNFTGTTDANV